MKTRLFLLLLAASLSLQFPQRNFAAPDAADSLVNRINQLKNQVSKDLIFLEDLQKEQKDTISSQVVLGIASMKSHFDQLTKESAQVNKSTPLKDLTEIEEKWNILFRNTSLFVQTARNTPRTPAPGDLLVTVRFQTFWDDQAVDGWRIGGIGTLYVSPKDVETEAEKLCHANKIPDYAFLTNSFKFLATDSQWIEERIRSGDYYMWTFHPADCHPRRINQGSSSVARGPQNNYVVIQLTTPDKKPKYKKAKKVRTS